MPTETEGRVRARRIPAEEFCALVRTEAGSQYRPYSEVLRMLAVGQAFAARGSCAQTTALLALPLTANVALAASLRKRCGGLPRRGGALLTTPVNADGNGEGLRAVLRAGLLHAARLGGGGTVWAALEAAEGAETLLPFYLREGLALRALCPLASLAPCYLFSTLPQPPCEGGVWAPLDQPAVLARLLCRGWAAVEAGDGAVRLTPV